jgi:3-methyladenine DNA glycosylase AlkD
MKRKSGIVSEIQKELRKLADEKTAEHSMRFFKTGRGQYGEGDIFLGIRVPVLRSLSRNYQDISLAAASALLESPFHEERLFALIVMVNQFKKGAPEKQEAIYRHYLQHTPAINNWDLVDLSAPYIPGAYLLERNRQPLYDLAVSANLWERRIAIVSTAWFIRHQDFSDTLRLAEILLNDREDLIHKAAGWMLREVGKRDQAVLEGFLKIRYKTMPRTMLRYAIERFEEEQRKAYLRGLI